MRKPFLPALFLFLFVSLCAKAQFPYNETFKNNSAPALVISGSARLTAAAGIDPVGQGYLRLTDNLANNVGYVYAHNSFPSNYGLTASFEFFSYKPGSGTNQADGLTFFLFDASVNSFRPGGVGGSLGYAQYYSQPGMSKGYIGISIDEFGNFSSATDGNKNGGPGQRKGSVVVRGPGNGKSTSDYVYLTGVKTTDAPYNIDFLGFTQRYPDPLSANYRKIKIIMNPGSSAGSNVGYKVTVIMYKGGAVLTPVTLIDQLDYPYPAPAELQFGLTASTGANTNCHEIRNLSIDVANTTALLAPTVINDNGVVACQGQQALIDVSANDHSNNNGGSINKETVDLDPLTAGQQTSFIDAGKGTYTVDQYGIVSFVPMNGYSGTSAIQYKLEDTYGISSTSASITVTVSNATGPALTLTNPAAVCAPGVVDITKPTLKTSTTPGSVFSYFKTLPDAHNNTNNINAAATSINQPDTYYVRADWNGCATIKPVVVQINQKPTTSNAGSDLPICNATIPASATLMAANPDIGIGMWTQVSGPSAATISFPNAATCPVSNMQKGVYVFRWSVANGACPISVDDVQISVGTVTANAGTSQNLVNATTATLAANNPAPGTGVWTQTSGPSLTITDPSNPATTLAGLTPGNLYKLTWKITNGTCVSTNETTVTNILNTVADAGPDRAVDGTSFPLTANTPGTGNTGLWSIVSQPDGSTAIIAAPNEPNTTINSINKPGNYVLRWTISNGSYINYDEITIHVGTILPVTWMSFSGKADKNIVNLKWETASEEQNNHFEIERSANGQQFETAGMVRGAGNTNSVKEYRFGDTVHQASADIVYYRIKQVDMDGKFSYSPTIKLQISRSAEITVWPNPFDEQIRVKAYFDNPGKALVTIYDESGKLIRREYINVYKGENQFAIEHLKNYSKGVWVIEISKGAILHRLKLVKR